MVLASIGLADFETAIASSFAPGAVRILFCRVTYALTALPRALSVLLFCPCAQNLVMTLGAKFATGCLVFDEGNAVNTADGLQVMKRCWTAVLASIPEMLLY